jgi:hypothetical protein
MNPFNQKILLCIVLAGIFLLFLLGQIQKPIAEGKIISIEQKSTYTLIRINTINNSIKVFHNTLQGKSIELNLTINQEVKIFGKKETYQGQEEIIADKIKTIN